VVSTARQGWRDLLAGVNAARSLVLAGGVGLHAVNIFLVTTILPSIVADLGGLAYYAWNTTLFVVASIVRSAVSVHVLGRLAMRGSYLLALALFALGTLACATAPSMAALLAGRSLQGLGGGMLVALSYAMIRHLFPAALWPQAIALVSGMWGVAALTGPFVGGVFAQLGAWRVAFWVLLPLVGGLAVLIGRVLGQVAGGEPRGAAFPGFRLGLLAVAVLSVSAVSLAEDLQLNAVGLVVAAVLMAALGRLDGAATERLLPGTAFRPATPLGATYATMMLLVVGTTTIIFVPLLLQALHGLTPLAAGYLTVVEALGWTGAALATSAARHTGARQAIAAGPATMLAGLIGLSWSIPDDGSSLVAIAMWLLLVGAGIGMGWAHLASRVLALAPEGKRDLAAASVSTVQLLATAFGSALAGMVVNLAGLSDPGSVGAVANAALWLFAVFAAAPALAGVAVFAILARPAAQPAGRGLPPS
jgi:MFS family permease